MNPLAVGLAAGTAALVLVSRRLDRRIPGPILAMLGGLLLTEIFGLREYGIRVLEDIAPIPRGLPPLTIPDFGAIGSLATGAVACAVLSLVESTSVARAISLRSGQRLEMTKEFTGQGIANLAAGFFGGYPVSGSLARSTLNYQSGAQTRLSAVMCGVSMLAVLLFLGPILGRTPVPCLAGLVLVVAADLIDFPRIRITMRSIPSDGLSFLATLVGTWTLSLDHAIYLGVGISLMLFLRRARLLSMRELAIGERGGFREIEPQLGERARSCPAIRVVNLTGPVFFAMSGELEDALEPLLADREIRVLIIRMRQTQMLDVTALGVLEGAARRLAAEGRHLLLLGLRPPLIAFLERTGAAARIGRSNLFPLEPGWFSAMSAALRTALAMVGDHACGSSCPFRQYLETSGERHPS
jgi:SulP family sulfate permease